ncbi:MAG: hypothetical protein PHG05_04395 [Candidatus Nanoarchaeia archaeon]|nr:hypothetical protein [Candidatus Nanoarchaeia archaeon]
MRDPAEVEKERELEKILKVVTEDPARMEKLNVGSRFLRALFFAASDRERKKEIAKNYKKEEFRQNIPRIKTYEELQVSNVVNGKIPDAPEPPKTEEIQFPLTYTLLFANNVNLVNVRLDNEEGKIIYNLVVPQIDEKVLEDCRDSIKLKIKFDKDVLKDDNYLIGKFGKIFSKKGLTFDARELEKVRYLIDRDWNNLGVIEGLFRDGNVLAIMIEGFNKPVYVDYRGLGRTETNLNYKNEDEVVNFIKKFVRKSGYEFDDKILSYNVKYGEFRLNATLGVNGTSSKFILRRE